MSSQLSEPPLIAFFTPTLTSSSCPPSALDRPPVPPTWPSSDRFNKHDWTLGDKNRRSLHALQFVGLSFDFDHLRELVREGARSHWVGGLVARFGFGGVGVGEDILHCI